MKTKIFLTALAFVTFSVAGMAGETKSCSCSKDKTECSKGKEAGKTKTVAKTTKTVEVKK